MNLQEAIMHEVIRRTRRNGGAYWGTVPYTVIAKRRKKNRLGRAADIARRKALA